MIENNAVIKLRF